MFKVIKEDYKARCCKCSKLTFIETRTTLIPLKHRLGFEPVTALTQLAWSKEILGNWKLALRSFKWNYMHLYLVFGDTFPSEVRVMRTGRFYFHSINLVSILFFSRCLGFQQYKDKRITSATSFLCHYI